MKTAVKSVLKRMWRAGAPVRRPFARVLARFLANQEIRLIAHLDGQERRICEHINNLGMQQQQMHLYQQQMQRDSTEQDLTLDSVVRELTRLQMQVEILQRTIDQEVEHRESSMPPGVFRNWAEPRSRGNEHFPHARMHAPLS